MKKTKKLSAMLLASVITAGTVSSLSAGAMVCYFNPDCLEKETTESFEHRGFNNYIYRHTFSSGTYDSPGSILDGCEKYTTIVDEIFYDYPEIHENYESLIVGSDIASGYLSSIQNKYGKNLSEYFLLCPLETAKSVDIETNAIKDSENYLIKAVWQEAPEIVVYSKDQAMPIDMDKLREIIPEAKVYSPQVQNNEDSYVFYISTKSGRNVTFATELEHLLTEKDIQSVISCKKDNLASVKYNGNWFCDTIYLPVSPDFSLDEIEAVSEFLASKEIKFTVADTKYNNNRKNVVFDSEIPADKYYELVIELEEKTGIMAGELCAYEEETVFTTESIEYFNILKGDANNDGTLALSDAIAILQTVGNPDTYGLTAQGAYNADIAGDFDGITNLDALTVQRKLLGLE